MTERPQPVPAPGGRRVFPTVTLIAGRKRGANTDEREWALLVAMNRIGQRGFEVAFFGEDQIVMKRQVK